MKPLLPAIFSPLYSLIAPYQCAICGKALFIETMPLCEACEKLFPERGLEPGTTCSICSIPLSSERLICARCRERGFHFTRSVSLFLYDSAVRDLLWAYKFGNFISLSRFFAARIAKILEKEFSGIPVVPVPGRAANIRRRGWDQVERIAWQLGRSHSQSVIRCLRRHGSASQKNLSREERRRNLAGRISLVRPRARLPEKLVLIDDVFTTGSTLDECAMVLREAGAESVYAVTIAMEE
jgi:ComF family protein